MTTKKFIAGSLILKQQLANSTVKLLWDLKLIATKGFSTVSYTEKCALYGGKA
jgi:hypothetical protein